MSNIGYIYKTTNLTNGMIYVGQHVSTVFDTKYIGTGVEFLNIVQQFGRDNFKCEILEWCTTLEELDDREIYWINYLNARDPNIGYNIARGGHKRTFLGCKHSEISKQKNSTSKLNSHLHWFNNGYSEKLCSTCPDGWSPGRLPTTEKVKLKIKETALKKHYRHYTNGEINLSIAEGDLIPEGFQLGMKDRGEDWRSKISEWNKEHSVHKGKKLSDEHRKCISDNQKGRILYNNGIKIIRLHINDPVPEGFEKGGLGVKGHPGTNNIPIIDLETNIIYNSKTDVIKQLKIPYFILKKSIESDEAILYKGKCYNFKIKQQNDQNKP